jgi:hypothetical protein
VRSEWLINENQSWPLFVHNVFFHPEKLRAVLPRDTVQNIRQWVNTWTKKDEHELALPKYTSRQEASICPSCIL